MKFKEKTLEPINMDSYESLLNNVYACSSAMVLTPDVKLGNLSIEEYLKIIDESVQILSQWNKKPIFVPLQFDLSNTNLIKILTHYNEKNYSNIWINFFAKPCDSSSLATLRTIRQRINKYLINKDTVLYFTHIEKEINPNIHDTHVAAFDILTQFNGADIIGVNRRMQRPFSPEEGVTIEDYWKKKAEEYNFKSVDDYLKARAYNKTRLFNPNSYYYCNIDSYPNQPNLPLDTNILLNDQSFNKFINSVLLNLEISRVKTIAEETMPKNVQKSVMKDKKQHTSPSKNRLKDYLNDKQVFKDNEYLKKQVLLSIIQHGLFDTLGSLKF